MKLYLLIYFLAGILQDFLFTLNVRYVIKGKVSLAVFSSFLVTIVNLLVLYNIITQLDSQKSIIAIVIYAFGIGAGTLLAMKFRVGLKD